MMVAETSNENQQSALHFIDHSDKVKLWEYAILVTNTDYSLDAIASYTGIGPTARMASMS